MNNLETLIFKIVSVAFLLSVSFGLLFALLGIFTGNKLALTMGFYFFTPAIFIVVVLIVVYLVYGIIQIIKS